MPNKLLILASIFSLLIGAASCDHKTNKKSILIKDCTGSYLQIKGSDFRICNESKVDHLSNGTEVIATFRATSSCENFNKYTCEKMHKSEGNVRISKIRTK